MITVTLKINPKVYKSLKTEALVYFLAHGSDGGMLTHAWGVIFRQIDQQVDSGATEVVAILGKQDDTPTEG